MEKIINKLHGKDLVVSSIKNRIRIIKNYNKILPEDTFTGFFIPGLVLSVEESKKYL